MEVFVIMIQSIFHLKSQRQRTLRLLFEDCRFIYFHSLMKSAFLPSKGLLCLYDKQNNTWLLVDMEFLFSCSTRHLTRSLRSLVSSELNTRREIPYPRAPMYCSLSIIFCNLLAHFVKFFKSFMLLREYEIIRMHFIS